MPTFREKTAIVYSSDYDMELPYYKQAVEGVLEQTASTEREIFYFPYKNQSQGIYSFSGLAAKDFKAAILFSVPFKDIAEKLADDGLKVVTLNFDYGLPKVSSVRGDSGAAVKTLTGIMLAAGSKKPALVAGPLDSPFKDKKISVVAQDAFNSVLDEAGISVNSRMVVTGEWHRDTVRQETGEFIDRGADSIIFWSEGLLLEGLKEFEARKIKIPRDFRIAAHCESTSVYPFTTAAISMRTLGKTAVEILDLLNPGQAQQRLVPLEIRPGSWKA